jgi:hypothetical protein
VTVVHKIPKSDGRYLTDGGPNLLLEKCLKCLPVLVANYTPFENAPIPLGSSKLCLEK